MFKKIIIYLCFLIFTYTSVFADIIKKITVDGNNRINTDTVILFSGLKIDADVSEIDLNNAVKKLFETNFFKTIETNFENSHLIFTISENPIVQNLTITGIKRKPIQKLLYADLTLKDSSPFIESFAKDDVKRIKSILQSVGYYFSTVESYVKDNKNGTIDLTYNINKGKKSFVDEIIFIGNKKIKSGKLLNVIATEEHKFWKILSNKKFLNNERINLDKRLLVNYYKNKGYYKVNVKNSTVKKKMMKIFNLFLT